MALRVNSILRQLKSHYESKAIVYSVNGPLSKVLSVHSYPLKDLQPNEVILKILAAPINPADVNIVEGTYPVKPHFHEFGAIGGNEGVAEIVELGSKVTGFQKGDWVVSSGQSKRYRCCSNKFRNMADLCSNER
jgi:NADPH:quinone reductase-like Zn-dependent oxidoreductase